MRTTINRSDSKTADKAPQTVPPSVFEALFNHAADGMVVMNQWRQVLYMNPAAQELLGTTEVPTSFCGDVFHCHNSHDGPIDDSGCFGQCVLSSREPLSNVEMSISTASGTSVPVAVTYSYIPFAGETGPYLLMSLRDISERKQLEETERQNIELQYTLQERERLARDLHDGVVQDIAYANMQTKLLLDEMDLGKPPAKGDLTSISQILERSFTELRQAIYDLTSRVSDDFKSYVKRYALDYGSRYRVLVHFQSRTAIPKLDPFVASQASKILQEALANVRKHSKAKTVNVRLEALGRRGARNRTVELVISDDGQGFNVTAQNGKEHYGMRTMRERADLIGAKLAVESKPDKGTTVKLLIPVARC